MTYQKIKVFGYVLPLCGIASAAVQTATQQYCDTATFFERPSSSTFKNPFHINLPIPRPIKFTKKDPLPDSKDKLS